LVESKVLVYSDENLAVVDIPLENNTKETDSQNKEQVKGVIEELVKTAIFQNTEKETIPSYTSPNKIKESFDNQCHRLRLRREELKKIEDDDDGKTPNLLPIGNYHPHYHSDLKTYHERQINENNIQKLNIRKTALEQESMQNKEFNER